MFLIFSFNSFFDFLLLDEGALDLFESLDQVSDSANGFCHDVFEPVGVLAFAGLDLVVDCLQFLLKRLNLSLEFFFGPG